nr:RNA-directed DNA polymerase, eukaryota, reverse transcriptase zinc-binding domain protein [Tanacetum cinerariifolium]
MFTRINRRGDKLSKLDRFLVSEDTASYLTDYAAQVIECHISDHRPIILSPSSMDFGHTPFKFYNSWLLDNEFHTIVSDFWEHYVMENGINPIVRFKSKMKALKSIIKTWSRNRSSSQSREKEENLDISQKAKVKWDIEADENYKFFHAIINQKRRYLSIHGINHEGIWLSNPQDIKDSFHSFFESKFKKVEAAKVVSRSQFYKTVQPDQNVFLTSVITEAEIREAVWDCGSDKSPEPDGFTFAFYKKFWDMIKVDVVAFVQAFFNTSTFPRGCNASFVALIPKGPNPMVISDFRPISLIGAQYKIIAKVMANRLAQVIDSVISHEQSAFIKHRQILDGPLMVNEVIKWCQRKKSKLMVFKIDF